MALLLTAGWLVVRGIEKPARPTSIVLVVLDTVRADAVSAVVTPRLDRLASEGLRFDQVLAAAPWTLPSHASLFTGLLPNQHGCTWEHRWLSDEAETLAETLSTAGFETVGVTTNPNVSSLYHLDQGFDHFFETWKSEPSAAPGTAAPSRAANDEIRRWFSERDPRQPYFLFVNYADAHLPYAPEPPFDAAAREVSERARHLAARPDLLQAVLAGEEKVTADDAAGLAALYRADVSQADARLGELLDLIQADGGADDTVVIVTSDHGEQLGDHGRVDHQLSLSEELLRVPLVVRYPRCVRPARIPEPIALTDVKSWIDALAVGRVPQWAPPPEAVADSFVAQYLRPVDLVDFVRQKGGDAAAIDRRLARVFAPDREGGGDKLLLSEGGGETWFSVDAHGVESPAAFTAARNEFLRARLLGALQQQPFSESLQTLAAGGAEDRASVATLRRLGYLAAGAESGATGVHASEHWAAARRAVAHGDAALARSEFERAARLAPAAPALLLEAARCMDRAGGAGLDSVLESFLRSLAGSAAADGSDAVWAKQRLAELRRGRG